MSLMEMASNNKIYNECEVVSTYSVTEDDLKDIKSAEVIYNPKYENYQVCIHFVNMTKTYYKLSSKCEADDGEFDPRNMRILTLHGFRDGKEYTCKVVDIIE